MSSSKGKPHHGHNSKSNDNNNNSSSRSSNRNIRGDRDRAETNDVRRSSYADQHNHTEQISRHGDSSSSRSSNSNNNLKELDIKANPTSSTLVFKPRGLVTKPKSKIQL